MEKLQKAFLENEELRKSLFKAKDKAEFDGKSIEEFAETAISIFKDYGVETEKKEIIEFIQANDKVEVSDGDLDEAAGGDSCSVWKDYYPCPNQCTDRTHCCS